MASRKEEKERLRQQRLAAERAAQSGGRRRLLAGYVVAGVLTLVENPDAGEINTDTIERAAVLVRYHLHEAARIVGTASVVILL